MKQSVACFFGALAISFSASATPAAAETNARSGMRITLSVPEVCDLRATSLMVETSQSRATGSVSEYCNTSRGYQITANHRPLNAGEVVELTYGGLVRQLEASGVSPVAFRSGARRETIPLSVRADRLDSPLNLSLALTAL